VHTGFGVVVLVDDEVVAMLALVVVIQGSEAVDRKTWYFCGCLA
jgi:Kef-type K+ transport system membrane component KefB